MPLWEEQRNVLKGNRRTVPPLPGCAAGCILADDMGLGKTLQAITLLWTCISAGHADLGGQ